MATFTIKRNQKPHIKSLSSNKLTWETTAAKDMPRGSARSWTPSPPTSPLPRVVVVVVVLLLRRREEEEEAAEFAAEEVEEEEQEDEQAWGLCPILGFVIIIPFFFFFFGSRGLGARGSWPSSLSAVWAPPSDALRKKARGSILRERGRRTLRRSEFEEIDGSNKRKRGGLSEIGTAPAHFFWSNKKRPDGAATEAFNSKGRT